MSACFKRLLHFFWLEKKQVLHEHKGHKALYWQVSEAVVVLVAGDSEESRQR